MEPETVSIEDLMAILESMNQFDPVLIASYISGYFLMLILGFTAGVVVKILKRA